MKKNILNVALFGMLLLGATACDKWFDVDSKTTMVQSDLFSKCEGMRTALNGIYNRLGDKSLYGGNLTWGTLSVVAYNYNTSKLPSPYKELINNGEFLQSAAESAIDPIWNTAYNVIANINNLYQEVEKRDSTFFIEGNVERTLFLAELRGLRGMMHFELARMYAPAPVVDDNGSYLPYVEAYPTHQPAHISLNEVMKKAIADLEYAKDNLAYIDTLWNTTMRQTLTRLTQSTDGVGGLFFQARGVRMNYFAASALLARAYLYMGDKTNAYKNADLVYQFAARKTWFKFTQRSYIATSSTNEIYRKLWDDILFAGYNQNEYTIYEKSYNSSRNFYLTPTDRFYTYDQTDYRKTYLIEGSGSNALSRKWIAPNRSYNNASSLVYDRQGPLLPIIRLSEVYFIMAECLVDSDPERANTLLQVVRTARGATKTIQPVTSDNIREFIYNEYLKEFVTEGQSFFLYKRLNKPAFNGGNTMDISGLYVFPKPQIETDYSTL